MAGGKNRAAIKQALFSGVGGAKNAADNTLRAVKNNLPGGDGGDGPQLLWGMLHIKIIKCNNLKNMDFSLINRKGLSDPYVTVNIGPTRIVKTTVKMNDLNPVYNEDYYCYVAHEAKEITFKVYDSDDVTKDDSIGKYNLSVRELIRLPDSEQWQLPELVRQDFLMRTGVHKVVTLSGKKKNGSLEFFAEFIPKHMLGHKMEVPGVYYPATKGNDVRFYVNADDDLSAPKVTYGGPNDDEKRFKPRRLWREIYDAMCEAKHLIYVVGWSVDVDQYLLRGEEQERHAKKDGYSSQIGPLLKAKAEEGVVVNLMQWDDFSSNIFNPGGKMGTHDEKTKNFFQGTPVNAEFMGTRGDGTNTLWQGSNKTMFFTHHQKFVVCDAPKKDGSGERELLAFVGGIDLTEGRWDNRQHSLFRDLDTIFQGDCYNKCYRFHDKRNGPRQPWHDIHSAVRGPEALDLVRAFRERWLSQVPGKANVLVELESLGFNKRSLENRSGWHCQLSRSIDARVTEFEKTVYQSWRNFSVDEMKPGSTEWISMDEDNTTLSRRFETPVNEELKFARTLDQKKGRDVDKSIELTNIHHIRRAKHFIYIESQYFLSSSHMWTAEKHRSVKCSNLIAVELALKICEKIAKGERFAVYILLPMWCEGLPDSDANQEILYWQWSTIEMMYRMVQDAIIDRCRNSSDSGMDVSDYLNFFCLGNREAKDGSETPTRPVSPDEKALYETRRHQIYIHSKFMIVDDEVALIGTANINQRSMDGCRDTEIMMTSWHPDHLATETSIAKGDIHGYRMHIWATITNKMLPEFRDPKSIECVRAMHKIAKKNWHKYSKDETTEMTSHLLYPPLRYYGRSEGVKARYDMPEGMFLDTKAPVKGKNSRIFPDIILT